MKPPEKVVFLCRFVDISRELNTQIRPYNFCVGVSFKMIICVGNFIDNCLNVCTVDEL